MKLTKEERQELVAILRARLGKCLDCRKSRGIPRGFGGTPICDRCWLVRCNPGARL